MLNAAYFLGLLVLCGQVALADLTLGTKDYNFYLEIGSHYAALARQKFTRYTNTSLALNSQGPTSLCLLTAGIKGMWYHNWKIIIFNIIYSVP